MNRLLNFFRPSVDKIISSLQKKAAQLENVMNRHEALYDTHQILANFHATETARASRIAAKFKDLIS